MLPSQQGQAVLACHGTVMLTWVLTRWRKLVTVFRNGSRSVFPLQLKKSGWISQLKVLKLRKHWDNWKSKNTQKISGVLDKAFPFLMLLLSQLVPSGQCLLSSCPALSSQYSLEVAMPTQFTRWQESVREGSVVPVSPELKACCLSLEWTMTGL